MPEPIYDGWEESPEQTRYRWNTWMDEAAQTDPEFLKLKQGDPNEDNKPTKSTT